MPPIASRARGSRATCREGARRRRPFPAGGATVPVVALVASLVALVRAAAVLVGAALVTAALVGAALVGAALVGAAVLAALVRAGAVAALVRAGEATGARQRR